MKRIARNRQDWLHRQGMHLHDDDDDDKIELIISKNLNQVNKFITSLSIAPC